MRYMKLLASTAGVVLAISASVGVSSASAVGSELCTVAKQNPCFHANMVEGGSTISAQLKPMTDLRVTLGLFGDLVCTESMAILETVNTGSTTEHVELMLEELWVNGCKFGGNKCTNVNSVNVGPGKEGVNGEFVAGTGRITLERNTAGNEWGIVGVCGFLNCAMTTGKMEVGFFSGSPAMLDIDKQPLNLASKTCPFVIPLVDAEYEITSPKPLYGVVR